MTHFRLPTHLLPLSVLIDSPERYILVGYSGDFPADNPGMTAGVHDGCSILGSAGDAFLRHNCDAFSGSSGGPILSFVNGEPKIVALNSADRTDQETSADMIACTHDGRRLRFTPTRGRAPIALLPR
ncbi:MAG: trypsin-like serine peptidase [Elainellaceae cyanobacterium]